MWKTPRRSRSIILGLLFSAAGCSHVEPSIQNGRIKDEWKNPSSRTYLRVRGIGIASPDTKDDAARRAGSREAALVAARKELLALVGGLRLTGGITVKDAMTIDSELAVSVDWLVYGAEEYRVEWGDAASCVVTLQVRRSVVEKMIAGVKPKDLPKPLPEPARQLWRTESRSEVPWTRADIAGRRTGLLSLPKTTLVLGFLVPGWAQIYAGQELNGDESMKMTLKGIGVMGGTLGLLAVAGDNLQTKSGSSGTAGSSNTKDNHTLAYGALGAAALLHSYGAWDGFRSLMANGTWVTLTPVPGGVQVATGRRF